MNIGDLSPETNENHEFDSKNINDYNNNRCNLEKQKVPIQTGLVLSSWRGSAKLSRFGSQSLLVIISFGEAQKTHVFDQSKSFIFLPKINNIFKKRKDYVKVQGFLGTPCGAPCGAPCVQCRCTSLKPLPFKKIYINNKLN